MTAEAARPRLSVLVVASHFPKPGNPTMGIWALEQAEALARRGHVVRVVSATTWLPRALARVPGAGRAAAWAGCPPEHDWGPVTVRYPRWPRVRPGPHARLADAHPGAEMRASWPFAARGAVRFARRQPVDVILAHGSVVNGWAALRLRDALPGRPPVVVEDHDLDEITTCSRLPRRRAHFAAVLDAAARRIAVSEQMAQAMRSALGAREVDVLPNGTAVPDPAAFGPRPVELDGQTVVLCAAGFYRRKRIPDLVEAFARVAARHPGAVLRIAGDGAERPAVARAIAASGLGDRITLLGTLPHGALLQEMAWADVFALAGVREPFGVVYLEALAMGTAPICCADAGVVEVLEPGTHVETVPPDDPDALAAALDGLLGAPERRGRMAALGAARVRATLSWDANARRLEEILRQACA